MTKEQLAEEISEHVKELFFSASEHMLPDGRLNDDHGLDSLDRIELCMALEKTHKVSINDDFVEEWGDMTPLQIAEQMHHLFQECVTTR